MLPNNREKYLNKLKLEKIDIHNLIRKQVGNLQREINSNIILISPENNINIHNTKCKINDQDFISTLNMLSFNIKEFYNSYVKGLDKLKLNNDSLI